jgi:hypothetical protein
VTVEERLLARGIEPTKEAVAAYHLAQRIADRIITDLEGEKPKTHRLEFMGEDWDSFNGEESKP